MVGAAKREAAIVCCCCSPSTALVVGNEPLTAFHKKGGVVNDCVVGVVVELVLEGRW